MKVHANAKLGPASRLALVRAIEGGSTLKQAAACFSVAPATAHRWWHRWLEAGELERASGAWLADRSSRPRRQPRLLSPDDERPIVEARLQTNLGPGRLAGIVRRARSTIWKVLRRHGLSRRRRGERQTYRRYEWSRPGALLHVDVKRLARFEVPGNRELAGQRIAPQLNRDVGWDYLHCVVDDHSRLAYVELHKDQRAKTAAESLGRAIRWFCEQGLRAPQAVMTDGALAYTNSRRFRALLAGVGATHIVIPPYTPRWNGKVERFIQTLQNEWAYAHRWRSSSDRARSLSSFLRYYNRQRPHSSLGDRPPVSRIHNLRG